MARPEKEPETEFAKRLRSVREHLGVAERAEFASKLGIPTTTYATWERGKNEPPATAITLLMSIFGVNIIWLLTGEGEMFSQSSPTGAGALMLDRAAMKMAIEALEEGLNDRSLPSDKKAELVLAAYDLLLTDNSNKDSVIRLVRAA